MQTKLKYTKSINNYFNRLFVITTFLLLFWFNLAVAAREASNELTLPSITSNSTDNEIVLYQSKIKTLISNPQMLSMMAPSDIKRVFNGLAINALRSKLPNDKWSMLRRDEVRLIGLLIKSIQHRVDPSISTDKVPNFVVPLPYDFVANPEDRKNDDKRKAYDDSVRAKSELYEHIQDQIQIRRIEDYLIRNGRSELTLLYPGETQTDSEVVGILNDVGVDRDTIKVLIN